MSAGDHHAPDAPRAATARCIVVTGPPCSGKSWVAGHLAKHLGLPLISKDDYKETLFDLIADGQTLDDGLINRAAYELLYTTLDRLLRGGVSLIVESNFRPARDSARLSNLFREHDCFVRQVHCDAPAEVLLQRFRDRWEAGQRHPGHDDSTKIATVAASLREQCYGPLRLPGPLLRLDTTDLARVDLHALVARLVETPT